MQPTTIEVAVASRDDKVVYVINMNSIQNIMSNDTYRVGDFVG